MAQDIMINMSMELHVCGEFVYQYLNCHYISWNHCSHIELWGIVWKHFYIDNNQKNLIEINS